MTTHRTFTIGQTLELKHGNFAVAGWGAGTFRLRNELTNEYQLLDHAELSRMLPPGVALETTKPKTPKPTLTEALEGLDDESRVLIPHLQELVDGTPAVGDLPREQYAPHIPMKWRLESKLRELRELGIDISIATLKRRLKRFREAGVAGLIDGRTTRRDAPLSRADEEVIPVLAKLIASYTGRSSPSYTRIRAELHRALIIEFPDPDTRPPLPSLSTVTRYVSKLSGNQNPTKAAKERETAALSPNRQFLPRLASAPGDECQIDTTWFDAFVRFPDGSVKRPYLSVLIDKRTRSIIGHNLTADAPTGYDHAVLLAKAIVPRKLRSWSSYYNAFGIPLMPWSKYLDDDQLKEFDAHRPYIFPRRIIIDNGQDYRSHVFRLACDRYGIHLTQSPVKDPTSKAQVERNFGTIRTMFAQYLPGYAQRNTEFRGEKTEEEDVLDLDVVAELFDRWVAVVWQNRRHDGLVDTLRPDWRHTPNTMYAASIELTGHFVAAYQEDDFIALMPTETRTVQADGIEFRGRTYDSPHLSPLRGKKTSDGVTAQIAVHYDPADIHRVWVRSPHDQQWVMCTWTEIDGFSRPLEQTLRMQAHKLTAEKRGFTSAESDDLLLQMRDELIAEEAAKQKLTLEATKTKTKVLKATETIENILAAAATAHSDYEDFMDLEVV